MQPRFSPEIRQQTDPTALSGRQRHSQAGSKIAKPRQQPYLEGNNIAKRMKRATDKNLPIREGRAIFISFR